MAEINKSLMRQYTTGQKFPSYDRALKIVSVINKIGSDPGKIKIAAPDYYQVAKRGRKKREEV